MNLFIFNNLLNYIQKNIGIILSSNNYLINNNIKVSITNRVKSKKKIIYKCFNKKKISNDIFGIRIIYENPNNFNDTITAYEIKKTLESNFINIPYFYDDYINYPKKNFYQSLHIYILYFFLLEIQIRNLNMHICCINGSASNYY